MLKKIVLPCLLLLVAQAMFAQTMMSDDDVVRFILVERAAQTSEQNITSKLLRKGVSTGRIQSAIEEVKKLEGMHNFMADGADGGDETSSRLRGESNIFVRDSVALTDTLAKSKVFGRDIFNNKMLTFAPALNIPTPQDYILGPGDQVLIDAWGTSQFNIKETISPDGNIFVDGVGLLSLNGLTVNKAEELVVEKLENVYSGSQISLTLGSIRSVQVQVHGEVVTPGTFTISAFSTAFNALYAAGGVNSVGTLRDIKVYRSGKEVSSIDVYDYILNGKTASDIRLQDNDVISVGAYQNIVDVDGKVKRPMKYEMKVGETLLDAISYAGGFTGDAYTENFNIVRKNGREYSMHTVSKPEAAAFELKDGDFVNVEKMLPRFSNMIEVSGAVFYPGLYELGDRISTIRELIAAAGGVVEEAFLNRAVLQHRNLDKTLETEPIDLKGILAGTTPDVKLKSNDLLFIPSSANMLGEQTVSISGEVNLPGKYKFAKNTTIEDLILQAGGLTRAASVMKIDVYRSLLDPKSTTFSSESSKSFSFSLKDGFMVDGGENFVLEPFDEVFVRRTPSYSAMQVVQIKGCVNYEGGYVLPGKDYRLSQLVKDAGGLSELAYVKGACLYRKMTEEERKLRENVMKTTQIQMLEESLKDRDKEVDMVLLDSIMQLKLTLSSVYPVAINLEEAVKNPGSQSDVLLRAGDVLNIPEIPSTINVSGEVRSPITMSYEEGKNVKYYIKHAGGYSNNAKKSAVYIIYKNGSVVNVSKRSTKVVEPGCEIVVPRKSVRNKLSLAEIATVGTSTASIATMIVAIINLLK